jgi:hypothetical protein
MIKFRLKNNKEIIIRLYIVVMDLKLVIKGLKKLLYFVKNLDSLVQFFMHLMMIRKYIVNKSDLN